MSEWTDREMHRCIAEGQHLKNMDRETETDVRAADRRRVGGKDVQ